MKKSDIASRVPAYTSVSRVAVHAAVNTVSTAIPDALAQDRLTLNANAHDGMPQTMGQRGVGGRCLHFGGETLRDPRCRHFH